MTGIDIVHVRITRAEKYWIFARSCTHSLLPSERPATGLFANISAVLVAVSTRNVTMFILFEVINLKYWEMSLVVKARRWAED